MLYDVDTERKYFNYIVLSFLCESNQAFLLFWLPKLFYHKSNSRQVTHLTKNHEAKITSLCKTVLGSFTLEITKISELTQVIM